MAFPVFRILLTSSKLCNNTSKNDVDFRQKENLKDKKIVDEVIKNKYVLYQV